MNIFLAGKMDRQSGNWRSAIVGDRYTKVGQRGSVRHPGWTNVIKGPESPDQWSGEVSAWLPIPRAVFGRHDYVGPFRQLFDYGWASAEPWAGHLPGRGDDPFEADHLFDHDLNRCNHGALCDCDGVDAALREVTKLTIFRNDIEALSRADLVFAVINSPDVFGTITEIALAWKMGKFVSLLVDPRVPIAQGDFWFVQQMVHHIAQWPVRFDTHPAQGNDGFPLHATRYASDKKAVTDGLRDALSAYIEWHEGTIAPDAATRRKRETGLRFRSPAEFLAPLLGPAAMQPPPAATD